MSGLLGTVLKLLPIGLDYIFKQQCGYNYYYSFKGDQINVNIIKYCI